MNKYQQKITVQEQNRFLGFLIDPYFQGIDRLFVLSFEINVRASYTRYFLPLVETKDYNVMIDGQRFFDQPAKNNLIISNSIRNISTGQGDSFTTGYLLDYPISKIIIR